MKTKQRVLLALLAAAVLLGAVLWAVTRSNAKAEQAVNMSFFQIIIASIDSHSV